MIVQQSPRLRQILFEVWRRLVVLFVWDVAVTIFYFTFDRFQAPALPVTLFGTALALLLGVRSNSAYQRWWEARTLWGAMINASRSLAREVLAFIPQGDARDLRRTLVLRQIAYVHALARVLRRQPADADVLRYLSTEEAQEGLGRTNIANGLLDGSARRVAEARRAGLLDSIQQERIEATMVDIANAQGGMERLKNTPLPIGFRFLPELFTTVFCLLLPIGLVDTLGIATPVGSTIAGFMFLCVLRIADDLVDPFAGTVHDVPLTTMCRTIEIDLLQAIGDGAPAPLVPDRGVLW